MNYSQAKLIIYSPEAYDQDEVYDAACYVIGNMQATHEDIYQASHVLCDITFQMGVS